TLIDTLTSAPYATSWSNVLTGTHTFTAKAYDNQGAVATSAAVSIGIASGAPAGAPIAVPNDGNADAGSLPGELSVGKDGTSSYSIPIAVPPGTSGMVPSLSLHYG